ncbi:hypothetical protein AB0O01_00845 [Streptomyces sp. NPDC093252]|uniref:hypothetical protein n=1 Tax=Streptomyces sp. NPDC093252 TaxID=3154980 RepID=UPI0034326748
MALNRRYSRLITVDGIDYRWQVRRNSPCGFCGGGLGASFVVQQVDPQGSLLVVGASHAMSPIASAVVRARVRSALGQGWMPAHPGAPFHLAVDG